jgi:hypothetical protein
VRANASIATDRSRVQPVTRANGRRSAGTRQVSGQRASDRSRSTLARRHALASVDARRASVFSEGTIRCAIRTDLYRLREQSVRAGDLIGYAGSPSRDEFKRLYFELWKRDRWHLLCRSTRAHGSPSRSSCSTTTITPAPTDAARTEAA